MLYLSLILIAFAVMTLTLTAQNDPAKTDPDKYKVKLENERIRVLEYTDKPGDRTNEHSHPDFMLYALSDFKRTLIFPDKKELTREFKKGDVIWMNAQTHIGVNSGTSETHALIVEMKNPAHTAEPEVDGK